MKNIFSKGYLINFYLYDYKSLCLNRLNYENIFSKLVEFYKSSVVYEMIKLRNFAETIII